MPSRHLQHECYMFLAISCYQLLPESTVFMLTLYIADVYEPLLQLLLLTFF